MSMTKTTTAKSAIYSFDGYSEGYEAYVDGAFVGKFIVPLALDKYVLEGDELTCLIGMRANGYQVSMHKSR